MLTVGTILSNKNSNMPCILTDGMGMCFIRTKADTVTIVVMASSFVYAKQEYCHDYALIIIVIGICYSLVVSSH